MAAFNDSTRPFWSNGPTPGGFYDFPGNGFAHQNNIVSANSGDYGSQRSSQPITTGTSVVGLKYDGGVIIAADTLLSYGSLAKYTDMDRVYKLNDQIIIGIGGDYADFQYIKTLIDSLLAQDASLADKHNLSAYELYNWLTRVLYNRRSRMNPLWLDLVVGGMVVKGNSVEPFLGHVNFRGRSYETDAIATGFGMHLGLPLMREFSDQETAKKTRALAEAEVKKVMEVLFYRDCRSFPKYKMAIASAEGTSVSGTINVDETWNVANYIRGY